MVTVIAVCPCGFHLWEREVPEEYKEESEGATLTCPKHRKEK